MTASRRVSAVEAALDPLAIVLRIIAENQRYPSLDACARAIAAVPVDDAPLSRIGTEVEASMRAASKGIARDEIERAVRRAVGDAIFRYLLFIRLNAAALEIADHEGLRAAALFYWMGCLLGGPRQEDLAPDAWAEHERDQAACWRTWRSVVASLVALVMVEEEAREQLEARYLRSQPALFADTHQAWDRFADQVDGLWAIAEVKDDGTASATIDAEEDPIAGSVADRARHLADDARITTFERLGEMPRAVAIVERRLEPR